MSDRSVAAAQNDDLVAALARAAVERAAPEELPLFRATSEAYLRDPASLEGGKSRDEMLGFGVEAAAMLVTPIALQVARDVLGFLHEQLRARAREQGEGAIDRLLARLVGKDEPAEGAEPVKLSDEELERVRAVALEKARALKLSDEKATLLADSLVGSLATA
ncbi:MAG TPA: hypothetical protein VLS46_01015 [Gaiellaceae bacterium]|nr:hypothetical protein [Gaiellaceae bacterium]